jgi:hypothetical protein
MANPWDPYKHLAAARERRLQEAREAGAAAAREVVEQQRARKGTVRKDVFGRKSVADTSAREGADSGERVSSQDVELVFDLVEDAGAEGVTQQDLVEAVTDLLDCKGGTGQGLVSRAILWLHREGLVVFIGRERGNEGGNTNRWKVAE